MIYYANARDAIPLISIIIIVYYIKFLPLNSGHRGVRLQVSTSMNAYTHTHTHTHIIYIMIDCNSITYNKVVGRKVNGSYGESGRRLLSVTLLRLAKSYIIIGISNRHTAAETIVCL